MGDELARLLVANSYLPVATLDGGMGGWTGRTVSSS
jgi:hypothetical protein